MFWKHFLRRSVLHIAFCWPRSINTPCHEWRVTLSSFSCRDLNSHVSWPLWLDLRQCKAPSCGSLFIDIFFFFFFTRVLFSPFYRAGSLQSWQTSIVVTAERESRALWEQSVGHTVTKWAKLDNVSSGCVVDLSQPEPFQQRSPASCNSMLQ